MGMGAKTTAGLECRVWIGSRVVRGSICDVCHAFPPPAPPHHTEMGVTTVAELANWKHYRLAKAIQTLSEVEVCVLVDVTFITDTHAHTHARAPIHWPSSSLLNANNACQPQRDRLRASAPPAPSPTSTADWIRTGSSPASRSFWMLPHPHCRGSQPGVWVARAALPDWIARHQHRFIGGVVLPGRCLIWFASATNEPLLAP